MAILAMEPALRCAEVALNGNLIDSLHGIGG